MKKLVLVLPLLIVMFSCSKSVDTERSVTILQELRASNLWHLDYSIYNQSQTYNTDGYMRFNESSSVEGMIESWFSKPSQSFPSYCYRLNNKTTLTDPDYTPNWTIDVNSENEVVFNNNQTYENGTYTFKRQNNTITMTYKEYENGLQLLPSMPAIPMTISNINPNSDLDICP